MFELVSNLGHGFSVALSPTNIMLCFVGALVGTLVGVLPGVGTVATIAMLIPLTYGLDPVGGLIMLAGIYYGAQYGGSTTSILVNIPGESTSVITTLDGYQMARNGQAGKALGIAAIGSFIAGCFATLVVAGLALPLTKVALMFGPAEYFALMVVGLVFAVVLAQGPILKALAMICLGLMLSLIGSDIESGQPRMTFGVMELMDGLGFANLAIGMFGFAEIMRNLAFPSEEERSVLKTKIKGLLPNMDDMKASIGAILRGTGIGSVMGILPGGGAIVATFAAYSFEKKLSKNPSKFGRGAIQGVAAPESANNAAAQTSFIPLLTLGIPSNAVMALMIGAMAVQGIIPGPQIITRQPELFWGMISSMWIANLMLLIINLPLVTLWVQLLKVPYRLMFPSIMVFCCLGVYSISFLPTDLMIAALAGLFAYLLMRHNFELAPLLLGFILGPLMEQNLRRAMLISNGDATVFLTRPISACLLALAAFLLITSVMPHIRRSREKVFVADD